MRVEGLQKRVGREHRHRAVPLVQHEDARGVGVDKLLDDVLQGGVFLALGRRFPVQGPSISRSHWKGGATRPLSPFPHAPTNGMFDR